MHPRFSSSFWNRSLRRRWLIYGGASPQPDRRAIARARVLARALQPGENLRLLEAALDEIDQIDWTK